MVIVVLAVVEYEGRVLLVQEANPRLRAKWNLPGGRVEPGESLLDALVREVREEAGIEVTPTDLIYVDQAPFGANDPGRLRFAFRATPQTHSLKATPDEHSLRAAWFEVSELASLPLRNAAVSHLATLAAGSPPALPLSAVIAMTNAEVEQERAEEIR